MVGFVTSTATAALVLDGIREAQLSRGTAYYWTTGAMPVYSGDHAGQMFIPASDALLATPLRPGLTPRDFPEFNVLVTLLGGLDARVDLPASDIIDPDQPEA
mgnify:CR=1 FL=1|tara:strand:- start:1057 stop:1362 length:306 start_codon:yes stop_codon:yes gene_type:complete